MDIFPILISKVAGSWGIRKNNYFNWLNLRLLINYKHF